MESSQQHDDALTLSSRLKRLPRNTRRLLSHINFTSDEDTLWKACQRKQILTIASDGGLKGRKGTFGWSVTTPKNDILCEGLDLSMDRTIPLVLRDANSVDTRQLSCFSHCYTDTGDIVINARSDG
ncbi:hypothetical protein MHU86_18463 [Fragilaria crotonensis]|nr:hypothetical protein MHU86_18463 [Fragilaria crotonensis]